MMCTNTHNYSLYEYFTRAHNTLMDYKISTLVIYSTHIGYKTNPRIIRLLLGRGGEYRSLSKYKKHNKDNPNPVHALRKKTKKKNIK